MCQPNEMNECLQEEQHETGRALSSTDRPTVRPICGSVVVHNDPNRVCMDNTEPRPPPADEWKQGEWADEGAEEVARGSW